MVHTIFREIDFSEKINLNLFLGWLELELQKRPMVPFYMVQIRTHKFENSTKNTVMIWENLKWIQKKFRLKELDLTKV